MAAFEFENFDQKDVYDRYEAAALSIDTLNIVIDFDSTAAVAAKNIDSKSIRYLLQHSVRTLLGLKPLDWNITTQLVAGISRHGLRFKLRVRT